MDQNEQMVFDVFFAGVVAMAHCHPGSGAHRTGYDMPAPKLSIKECADLALEMIEVRRQVMAQHGV